MWCPRSSAKLLPLALLALAACATGGGQDTDNDNHMEPEVPEDPSIASPLPGRGVSLAFGVAGDQWATGYHTGDDYRAPTGATVVATKAGTVVGASEGYYGTAYGLQVVIDSGGVRHLYAHLSSVVVGVGQKVVQGERIGAVGTSGNTSTEHLHYEERVSPYGYYNHRKPVFNHEKLDVPEPPPQGLKNWIYGREHADVVFLQRALVSAGCDVEGKYNTRYDDKTKLAVECFQKSQGWSGTGADGIVGALTVERLWLVGDVTVSQLTFGSKASNSVKMLQQRINEVRNTQLVVSGNYGVETRDAVKAWQISIGDTGVGADGNMGPKQSALLFPEYRYIVR